MKTFFFLCLVLLLPFNLNAALYKWIDENGEVVYSDQPPHAGAEELKPPGLTTTPAIKYKPKAKPEPEKPELVYTKLQITSPTADEHIRDAEGTIAVTIAIDPPLNLAEGHYLAIQVNGETKIAKLTSTSAILSNADRGTTNITASVLDKTGKTLISSEGVTVFVHRPSMLHPKPK